MPAILSSFKRHNPHGRYKSMEDSLFRKSRPERRGMARYPLWTMVMTLAFMPEAGIRAQEPLAEMRALIKSQGEKLERQGKLLEEQERLIRQQKDWLEREITRENTRPRHPASRRTGIAPHPCRRFRKPISRKTKRGCGKADWNERTMRCGRIGAGTGA